MKKRITIFLLFILIVAAVIYSFFYGVQEEFLPIGSKLPSLRYYSAKDSGMVTISNKPIMIMFFKPDCPHCEYEFEAMNKRYSDLRESTYFLTTDYVFIKDNIYKKWTNLVKKENIVFAYINEADFKKQVNIHVTPLFLFYDKTGYLIDKLFGEAKFDRILGSIKKAGGAQHQ